MLGCRMYVYLDLYQQRFVKNTKNKIPDTAFVIAVR